LIEGRSARSLRLFAVMGRSDPQVIGGAGLSSNPAIAPEKLLSAYNSRGI
jgi:hypothetical protein